LAVHGVNPGNWSKIQKNLQVEEYFRVLPIEPVEYYQYAALTDNLLSSIG
jgi:hypothetical protein